MLAYRLTRTGVIEESRPSVRETVLSAEGHDAVKPPTSRSIEVGGAW